MSPDDGSSTFEYPFAHFDKLIHFALFFVEMYLLYHTRLLPTPVIAMAVTLALAAITEFTQGFVPGRNPDIWDFIADAGGTIFAFWLILVIKKS